MQDETALEAGIQVMKATASEGIGTEIPPSFKGLNETEGSARE